MEKAAARKNWNFKKKRENHLKMSQRKSPRREEIYKIERNLTSGHNTNKNKTLICCLISYKILERKKSPKQNLMMVSFFFFKIREARKKRFLRRK